MNLHCPLFVFCAFTSIAVSTAISKPQEVTLDVMAHVYTASDSRSRALNGTRYVLTSGNAIDEGRILAGDELPAMDEVVRALRLELAARGSFPADSHDEPDLLLICHWGVLRNETWAAPGASGFSQFGAPHVHVARARLLAAPPVARRLQDDGRIEMTQQERDVARAAMQERCFVVLSAYSYRAFKQGRTVLLWRVKSSRETADIYVREAIVAAARACVLEAGSTLPLSRSTVPAQLPHSRVPSVLAAIEPTTIDGLGLPPGPLAQLFDAERRDVRGLGELPLELLLEERLATTTGN